MKFRRNSLEDKANKRVRISLKAIIKKKLLDDSDTDQVEPYLMYDTEQAKEGDSKAKVSRKLIIKKSELTFDGVSCMVISLKDMTADDKLEKIQQSETNLKLLTTQVSHQMLDLLQVNVDLAEKI